MAIEDLIQTRLDGDSFTNSRLDHPIKFWGPPLAPAGSIGNDDLSVRREGLGPAKKSDAHSFKRLKNNHFAQVATSFQPHQALIGGAVVVAALGMAALAYIWASAGEKIAAQSEQSGPAVQSSQSSSEPPAQTASRLSVSSADPSVVAAAWPDLPASTTVETSEVASAAAPGEKNAAPRQTVSASQNQDIVFLQRPGVHVRSGPSANAPVLGTARKGTRFAVTNREGDWVQVESEQLRGWIRSRFLAATEPR